MLNLKINAVTKEKQLLKTLQSEIAKYLFEFFFLFFLITFIPFNTENSCHKFELI